MPRHQGRCAQQCAGPDADGADDYLTKPFDLRELALRCEALARRQQLHVCQEMRVGPVTCRRAQDAPCTVTQRCR